MQKFNKLKSIPAYLPIVNIDTDMIIPKQFLKTIKRTGLGKNLFFEMRYDDQGKEINDFVLNKDPFNQSKILIAGKNFGCGSSREHAPWALLDFGITCVISSSYADIFFSNCFKNGILPIILEEEKIKELSEYANRQADNPIAVNSDGSETGDVVDVGDGLNLVSGYLFDNDVELTGRYTTISLEKEITGSDLQSQYTFGLSKYFKGHKLKVQTDVSYLDIENNDTSGLMYRMQFELHF